MPLQSYKKGMLKALGAQFEKMKTVFSLYVDLEILLQLADVLKRTISCLSQVSSVDGSLPPHNGMDVFSQDVKLIADITKTNPIILFIVV